MTPSATVRGVLASTPDCGQHLCRTRASLGDSPLLYFGEKYLWRRNVVPVFSPPNTVVLVQSPKLFFTHPPIRPAGWPCNYTPTWTADRVGSFAVVVACCEVVRTPLSARVIVRVFVPAPGFLDTRLRYAAWRSSYSSRASIGVRYASFSLFASTGCSVRRTSDGRAHLGEVVKDPAVKLACSLRRAIPALDDADGFRLFNEAEAGVDAPVPELVERTGPTDTGCRDPGADP